jgi:hypothetical protein
LRLGLSLDDLDSAAFVAGAVVVRLKPAAAQPLRKTTRTHVGRVLELTIDGIPALWVRVQTGIDCGIV